MTVAEAPFRSGATKRKGFIVRRRLILGLVPILLAGTAALASPLPALAAAGGAVETGTTTYVVNTAKSEIDVTIKLSIKNTKPPDALYDYYYTTTAVGVEVEAGPVKSTSNAGAVKQSLIKTGTYYRDIQLVYAKLWYGQTRVITLTYAIPAAPHAPGGFRAGKAYTELCAVGNGFDSGSVSVIVPDGFDVAYFSGTDLSKSGDAKGLQTFGSGTIQAPYKFWTCLEATDPANLTSTKLTAGDQSFNLQAWPEDASWASTVSGDVQSDVQKLEDLTGLHMPGGTIAIKEAGNSELGDYAGVYSPSTKTATVTEATDHATIAHELSHIWFNKNLFTATWMDEGFAGYSEKVAGSGNYQPCVEPGSYPGSGSPDLTTWQFLDINSTTQDQNITDWQYAASCYLVANLADAIGPANFKSVLVAASKGEIPYVGSTPAEKSPVAGPPVSARTLLDLFDERGMVPAGVKDLDQAQTMFGDYGIFGSTDLVARSKARSNYHTLLDAANAWKLPLAIRNPMASWDFSGAQRAMDVATQIIILRDQTQKGVSGFSLDGTPIQTQFQAATTQADLDAVLALTKKEVDAAAKVAQAKQLNDSGHSIFQTVGLLGTDPGASIALATTALKNAKPDDARAAAQKAIDAINGSGDQGLIRLAVMLVLILAVVAVLLFLTRRRRRRALALAAAAPVYAPPPGVDATAWYAAQYAAQYAVGYPASPPPPPPTTWDPASPPPPPPATWHPAPPPPPPATPPPATWHPAPPPPPPPPATPPPATWYPAPPPPPPATPPPATWYPAPPPPPPATPPPADAIASDVPPAVDPIPPAVDPAPPVDPTV
jgi:hypothetical protein